MNPNQNQNAHMQEQLAAAYPKAVNEQPQTSDASALSPEDALAALNGNPVGFIRDVVDKAALEHWQRLKEEAELEGALRTFRKAHPDARQFEPFIMQEVADLIQNDDDGVIDPWHKLLEKGLEVFKKKFKATLKNDPGLLEKQADETPETVMQMEGRNNRTLPKATASFTRDQIAKMSLSEFVAQEEALNEALKSKRIR